MDDIRESQEYLKLSFDPEDGIRIALDPSKKLLELSNTIIPPPPRMMREAKRIVFSVYASYVLSLLKEANVPDTDKRFELCKKYIVQSYHADCLKSKRCNYQINVDLGGWEYASSIRYFMKRWSFDTLYHRYFVEQYRKQFIRDYIELLIEYRKYRSNGSYTIGHYVPIVNSITVKLDSELPKTALEFEIELAMLEHTLHHELMHYAQVFLKWIYSLPEDAGLLTEKSKWRSKSVPSEYYPYVLDAVLFLRHWYPRVVSDKTKFVLGYFGKKPIPHTGFKDYPNWFFVDLKTKDPELWKKSVDLVLEELAKSGLKIQI